MPDHTPGDDAKYLVKEWILPPIGDLKGRARAPLSLASIEGLIKSGHLHPLTPVGLQGKTILAAYDFPELKSFFDEFTPDLEAKLQESVPLPEDIFERLLKIVAPSEEVPRTLEIVEPVGDLPPEGRPKPFIRKLDPAEVADSSLLEKLSEPPLEPLEQPSPASEEAPAPAYDEGVPSPENLEKVWLLPDLEKFQGRQKYPQSLINLEVLVQKGVLLPEDWVRKESGNPQRAGLFPELIDLFRYHEISSDPETLMLMPEEIPDFPEVHVSPPRKDPFDTGKPADKPLVPPEEGVNLFCKALVMGLLAGVIFTGLSTLSHYGGVPLGWQEDPAYPPLDRLVLGLNFNLFSGIIIAELFAVLVALFRLSWTRSILPLVLGAISGFAGYFLWNGNIKATGFELTAEPSILSGGPVLGVLVVLLGTIMYYPRRRAVAALSLLPEEQKAVLMAIVMWAGMLGMAFYVQSSTRHTAAYVQYVRVQQAVPKPPPPVKVTESVGIYSGEGNSKTEYTIYGTFQNDTDMNYSFIPSFKIFDNFNRLLGEQQPGKGVRMTLAKYRNREPYAPMTPSDKGAIVAPPHSTTEFRAMFINLDREVTKYDIEIVPTQ